MKENISDIITIIIVYTNMSQLQEAEKWIDKQLFHGVVEKVFIDNRNKIMSSAAKALNYGAKHSRGDVLVCMHQDVYLWDLNSLEKVYEYCINNKSTILGVAGAPKGDETHTDIFETSDLEHRGKRLNGIELKVDAIDECMICMHKTLWETIQFDEKCCNDWHGYAMDICFSNTIIGGINIAFPLEIYHDSKGNPNGKGFVITIKNLIKKYKNTKIERIHGTCIDIECSMKAYYKYYLRFCINQIKTNIIKMLKK